MAVKDFVVDNDIDILAMTKTWPRPGTNDSVEVGNLCPTGYRVIQIHVPRFHSAGGGVGIKSKNSIHLNISLTEWEVRWPHG